MWRKAPLLCGFFLVSNLASPASEVVGYLGRAQPCFWRPGENRLVLAHAPNKPLLAIGGKTADGPIEKPIEIVNTESARIIQRCRAGDGYLTSVAFSGDGTLLFSGTENGTVHIWNVAKGSQIAKLEFHSWITALAAGSDNNLLAVGDKTGRVHMIDLSTKTIVGKRKAHKGAVHALEFTPDASILATAGNDGTVRFYRSKPFKLVRHFLAHRGRVASIAFSPDGKQLASGGKDNKLNMWQVNSGELLCALEEGGEVRNIIWLSKNKRIICSVGNHTLAFICMIKEVKKITHIFSDHINSIAVSHNEERLAVASPQRIQLYHLQQLINNSGHLSEICSISFSPSTRRLASADETGRICVWDIESRTQMCTFQDADFDTDVAFVSEQVLAFVSASKGVCLRNIENGKEVATFASCTAVTDFELSTDKRFMAIAVSKGPRLGDGSQFQIWDVDKKRKLSHFDVPTATYSFCFSPCDQAKVFVEEVAESSTTLAVYDALAGKRISQVRLNEHYERLAYLTGARTAVAVRAHSEPGMYSLGFYNLSDARLVRSSEVFHALGIECLSCSDDGRFVLVFDSHRCETNNGRILVFECASGKLVHTLITPLCSVRTLASTGTLHAAAGEDYRIRLWESWLQDSKRNPFHGESNCETLFSALEDKDPNRALFAAQRLVGLKDHAVKLCEIAFRPIATIDSQELATLVKKLSADEFQVRVQATQKLIHLGEVAEPLLMKLRKDKNLTLETRKRIEHILAAIQLPNSERLRVIRTVMVLESIGSEKARGLTGVAGNGRPEAWRTKEAKAALLRLKRRENMKGEK